MQSSGVMLGSNLLYQSRMQLAEYKTEYQIR